MNALTCFIDPDVICLKSININNRISLSSDATDRERDGPDSDPVFTRPVLQQAGPADTEWRQQRVEFIHHLAFHCLKTQHIICCG